MSPLNDLSSLPPPKKRPNLLSCSCFLVFQNAKII